MSKKIIGIIVLIILIVGVIVIVSNDKKESGSQYTPIESNSTTTPNAIATTTYSMMDVSKHAVEGDCWSSINGTVYDLGAWINKHPGGSKAILSICGKDGTKAYEGQHGGNASPAKVLAGFEIGILK